MSSITYNWESFIGVLLLLTSFYNQVVKLCTFVNIFHLFYILVIMLIIDLLLILSHIYFEIKHDLS